MAKYFGTNGIRGKADFLTPEFVSQICSAYGTWIKGGKIVVGRDCRLNGVGVKASAIKGLLSVGCEVVDLGVAPSPTVEFAVRNLGAASGLTVTASHNPPEWNGLKFTIKNGVSLTAEKGEEVEEIYESKKFHFAKSSEIKPIITYNDAIRDHLDAIKKHINVARIRARNPLLVLDCGNGTACASTPLLFKELGCRAIVINGTPDGHFPGRPSEPKKETLGELMARVQSEKADLGIAWDGDADRVAFIDEKGDYLSGSESFALSAIISLRERGGKGTVISTVSTSNVVKEVAEKNGGIVILTKVGSPYIAEKIAADSSVAVGGEDTGGTFWPELSPTKDGLMTAAKIVEELCVSNKPM